MNVPQDLELLQVYSSNLSLLLNQLSVEQVLKLNAMLNALHGLIFERLRSLENSQILPTVDDHYYDFCSHCLSLPRDRIRNLIMNPIQELSAYSLYYKYSDRATFENEGYLTYALRNYIEKRFNLQPEDISDKLLFLQQYQNVFYR